MELRIPYFNIFSGEPVHIDKHYKQFNYFDIIKQTFLPHFQFKNATIILIILLIIIFIIEISFIPLSHSQFLQISSSNLPNYFFLQPSQFKGVGIISIFTASYLHFNYLHLILNSITLFILSEIQYCYGTIICIIGSNQLSDIFVAGIYSLLMSIVLCQEFEACDNYIAGSSTIVYSLIGMLVIAIIVCFRQMNSNIKYYWACGISVMVLISLIGIFIGSGLQKVGHGFGFLIGMSMGLATCRFINNKDLQVFASYIFIPVTIIIIMIPIFIIIFQ